MVTIIILCKAGKTCNGSKDSITMGKASKACKHME